MTKAALHRMTLEIVKIRRLQLDKARHDAQCARHEVDRVYEQARLAKESMQACASQATQALRTSSELSPAFLTGWIFATDAAHSLVQRCHSTANQAHADLRWQMKALQRQQEQLNEANRLAVRAGRQLHKKVDEKLSSAAEDRFLAYGTRR